MAALATKFSEKRIFTLADLPALEAQRRSSPSQPSNGLSGRLVTLGNLSSKTQDKAEDEALVCVRESSTIAARVSEDVNALERTINATFDRVEQNIPSMINEAINKMATDNRRDVEQSSAVMTQRFNAMEESLIRTREEIAAIAREQREIEIQMDNRSFNVQCLVITALALAIFLLLAYLA